MTRWGMVIDLDRCTACGACVVACKIENNVPFSSPDEASKGRAISWMEIISVKEKESNGFKISFLPRLCFHCENPPCIRVCPVGATYKNKEGLVTQIYPRCIGCRYCANACPYTAKYFNWYEPEWPEDMKKSLNPDVSIRTKGVIEKCTFCYHRLVKAKEKARVENKDLNNIEYVPACVEICPSNAMYFGDLDDPLSEVAILSRSERAFRLLEELGTEPKVIYLKEIKNER
ncbi:MAG: 4Fe-4S dicluster domain-containing protein [Acidobacteriota bacterium]